MSTYDLIGIPTGLAILIVSVAFYLVAWPIVHGKDFGPIKFPNLGIGKGPKITWIIFGCIVFIASLVMFIPHWEDSESVALNPGDKVSYKAADPSVRTEQWLSFFGTHIQDLNIKKSFNLTDFRVLILESKPFSEQTRKLTLEISPIDKDFSFDSLYAYQTSGPSIRRNFVELSPSTTASGYEIVNLEFEKGDTVICLFDLRMRGTSTKSFPSTSQLQTFFKLEVK